MHCTISLIGYGSIGRDLLEHLDPELTSGALRVAGIVVRSPGRHEPPRHGRFVDLPEAIAESDLVIECAGVAAAEAAGPAVIESGRDLLLTSMGALADPRTAGALSGGPGRVIFTSGAIGGLDLIRAAAQAGGLDRVSITTTKAATSLVQPWMDDPTVRRLHNLDAPETIFEGTPIEAIAKFPQNVNIAVALGVAARGLAPIEDGLAQVRVRIVADPDADASVHVIEAEGSTGNYRFEIGNRPSAANPRSSALTAQALAADIREYLAARG